MDRGIRKPPWRQFLKALMLTKVSRIKTSYSKRCSCKTKLQNQTLKLYICIYMDLSMHVDKFKKTSIHTCELAVNNDPFIWKGPRVLCFFLKYVYVHMWTCFFFKRRFSPKDKRFSLYKIKPAYVNFPPSLFNFGKWLIHGIHQSIIDPGTRSKRHETQTSQACNPSKSTMETGRQFGPGFLWSTFQPLKISFFFRVWRVAPFSWNFQTWTIVDAR